MRRAQHPHLDRHRRAADVQDELARQGLRLGCAHGDVHAARAQPRSRGHQRRAALDRAGGHASKVQRDAGHRADLLARLVRLLQGAHDDVAAGELEVVADPDGTAAERAGDDRPGAPRREDPVDEEPDSPRRHRLGQAGDERAESGTQLVQALTGHGADADPGDGATEPAPDVRGCRRGVRQVAARDRQQDVLDAQRLERCHVLARLPPPALVRRDDEQDCRDGPDAGQHRGQEALVAGDVDEGDATGRQVGPRVPELDGQAATVLLGEPVRVAAGQGPDEGRLAVVDMTSGGDDEHRAHRRRARRKTWTAGGGGGRESNPPSPRAGFNGFEDRAAHQDGHASPATVQPP